MTMRHVIHTTRGPRVAAKYAPGSESRTANHSVLLNRLEGVPRARRVVPTDITVKGRDHGPISAKQHHRTVAGKQQQKRGRPRHCHGLGHRPVLRSSPFKISLCRVVHETPGDPGSARITRSVPVGRDRTTSCPIERKRRVTRFRVTALPTFFETMKPTRVTSSLSRVAT